MPYFYVVNQPNSKIGTSFIFFNMRLLIELFLYLRAVIIWTWICMEYHNSSYSTWLMVNYCRGYRSGLYTVCLEVYLVTHRVEICQKPCLPGHCEFLEYWNTQKSVWRIWQHFSCPLDEGIPKIWKKLNSHGGFLRAD